MRGLAASLAALLLGVALLLFAGRALDLPFSLSRSPSKTARANDWQTLLSRWFAAATSPNSPRQTRSTRNSTNAAFSSPLPDPALRLANQARHAANIALPQDDFGPMLSFRDNFQAPQSLPALRAPLDVATFAARPAFGEQRVTADAQNALRERARRQQIGALQSFLDDVATRQAFARRGAEGEARGILDDDIANALRLNLPGLTPDMLSDPLRLELTNLRLKLAPNLGISDEERQRAAKRLSVVEAQWRARLRAQEAGRATELDELRRDRPLRLRREGEAQIEATTRQAQARDDTLRAQLQRDQNRRIADDFSQAPLGITLPAASKAASKAAPKAAPTDPEKTGVLAPSRGF